MLGGNTPFFRLIYEIVPGTKFFRAPSTIIYVFGFALSVLAASVRKKCSRSVPATRVVLVWLGFAALIALLASGGAVANASSPGRGASRAHTSPMPAQIPAAVPQITEQVMARNRGPLLFGAWRAFLFTALAGLCSATCEESSRARPHDRSPRYHCIDLWSIESQVLAFYAAGPHAVRERPGNSNTSRTKKEPGRVLVRAPAADSVNRDLDPYFGRDLQGKGTGFMVHGIRTVTGYHGNELGRYDQLALDEVRQNLPVQMTPAFWRHENVRYLYVNIAVPDTQLKLLAGPVKNSAGSTAFLYRLPGDNPYAWVASGMTKAADSNVLPAVLDPRFDPLRLAVFSDTSALQIAPVSSLPAPSAITTTTSNYGPGHATIALSQPATAGSALVVSENYFPGWKAVVDGKPQPTFRADYNLIGVPLPAGARTVELSFHDAAVDLGKGVTLVAIALAALLLAGGIVLDRRRVA